MISVEQAKSLLFENIGTTDIVEINISNAFTHLLAEDIYSPIDIPQFNQSSMDGYALAKGSPDDLKEFNVVGEIKAGDKSTLTLIAGQAARIFTGASIPNSADAIVIQENVGGVNGSIILSKDFQKGIYIRQKGSQIRKGELALKRGTYLNAAAIGFLASLGIDKVKVYRKPTVSIISTGDEIILPGNELKAGQVYESNSFSLSAALQQMQISPSNILYAPDNKSILKKHLEKSLQESDITILSGGISVGDYDFALTVLKELSVEQIFYKVAQKPGKPLFAGQHQGKLIFALPGNPAAALTCFYEYVYPSIRKMMGIENYSLPTVKLNPLKEINKTEDRAWFLRAKRIDNGIMPLDGQDSNALRSFVDADALIYLPSEKQIVNKNEMVEVHILP